MASSSQTRRSRREQLAAQRLAEASKDRRNKIMFFGLGVVVFALVVGFATWGIVAHSASAATGGTDVPPNANAAKNGIYLAPPTDGAPTFDMWLDYNCAVCRGANLTLSAAMDSIATSGQVNIVIHPLSFEGATSGDAAVAAACADIQGVFPAYNNQLFIDQPTDGSGLTDDQLRATIPDEINMTPDEVTGFQTCFDNQATGRFVAGIQTYGSKHGITNTPQFDFGGKDVTTQLWNTNTNTYDPDLLRSLLGVGTAS